MDALKSQGERRLERNGLHTATMAQGTLILICGLPGAGKTTLAKRLSQERGAVRMCPDDWIEAILEDASDTRERDRLRDPVENLQWDLTKVLLQKGLTVILENGFWSEEERTQYACEALEVGARIELFYTEAPDFERLWSRVKQRNSEIATGPYVMSEDELRANWSVFEAPMPEEIEFYDAGGTVLWTE
jgi:predicted kinase